jgi:hypothetical protein
MVRLGVDASGIDVAERCFIEAELRSPLDDRSCCAGVFSPSPATLACYQRGPTARRPRDRLRRIRSRPGGVPAHAAYFATNTKHFNHISIATHTREYVASGDQRHAESAGAFAKTLPLWVCVDARDDTSR